MAVVTACSPVPQVSIRISASCVSLLISHRLIRLPDGLESVYTLDLGTRSGRLEYHELFHAVRRVGGGLCRWDQAVRFHTIPHFLVHNQRQLENQGEPSAGLAICCMRVGGPSLSRASPVGTNAPPTLPRRICAFISALSFPASLIAGNWAIKMSAALW